MSRELALGQRLAVDKYLRADPRLIPTALNHYCFAIDFDGDHYTIVLLRHVLAKSLLGLTIAAEGVVEHLKPLRLTSVSSTNDHVDAIMKRESFVGDAAPATKELTYD